MKHWGLILSLAFFGCVCVVIATDKGQLVHTPAQLVGQSGSKKNTCFYYGQRPLVPQPVLPGTMATCCWYQSSTCCYWIGTKNAKYELYEVVLFGGISPECYYHLADIYCAGCAPNTADFTTIKEDDNIDVTLCKNTCYAFYKACETEANQINIYDPIQFCENYQRIFRIDDDDDENDDLNIRVSRTSDENCFHSFSSQDGGAYISQFVGTKEHDCIPPLQKTDSEAPWPEAVPHANPVPDFDIPKAERLRLSNFDFPFPLPPFQEAANGQGLIGVVQDVGCSLVPYLTFVWLGSVFVYLLL